MQLLLLGVSNSQRRDFTVRKELSWRQNLTSHATPHVHWQHAGGPAHPPPTRPPLMPQNSTCCCTNSNQKRTQGPKASKNSLCFSRKRAKHAPAATSRAPLHVAATFVAPAAATQPIPAPKTRCTASSTKQRCAAKLQQLHCSASTLADLCEVRLIRARWLRDSLSSLCEITDPKPAALEHLR